MTACMAHTISAAKSMVLGVAMLLGFTAIAHCATGCATLASQAPTKLEQQYTVDLTACSSGAKDKAEAKACRQRVNREYGLCDDAWPKVTPCDE